MAGLRVWLGVLLLALAGAAWASEPPALRVRALQLPLAPALAAEIEAQGNLPVQLFLPPGEGPFPLALIHHERRFYTDDKPRYPAATAYFLAHGYAVALPQRLGYGERTDAGDREHLDCRRPNPQRLFHGSSLQTQAVLQGLAAQGQPVDTQRVVLVGAGVGGWVALSAAAAAPQGVRAVLNFGGGAGAAPEKFPGEPCGVREMAEHARALGRSAGMPPSLWLYALNDRHFGPSAARRWHQPFSRGGARSEFHVLPAFGDDGSRLLADGLSAWKPLVDAFLLSLSRPQESLTDASQP